MRVVVGHLAAPAALIAAIACQAEPELSSTTQAAVVLAGSHDFGAVAVGDSSAVFAVAIAPASGSNGDTIDAVIASCPDFAITAPGLPAVVDDAQQGYAFTATFTPTVAGPLSCVVALTIDGVPDRTVTLTGTGVAPPVALAVTPAAVELGDVRSGVASSPVTVTVHDLGATMLSVTGVTVSAGYALSGPSAFSVAAGGSQALGVTCHPAMVGATNGTLAITSNDPQHGTLSVPLTCNGVASNIAIAPSPATLPVTRVGVPVMQTIALTNAGSGNITFDSAAVTGPGLTIMTSPAAGAILKAGTGGGALEFVVEFDAVAHGTASGTLTLTTSEGTRTAQISATALQPSMSVTPDGAVDLGPVCMGSIATQTFTVVGNGDGPFQLVSLSTPAAPFGVQPPATLPASVAAAGGNQVGFGVTVAPRTPGPVAASLAIGTDLANATPHTIQLAALGLAAGTTATPSALDLGASPLEIATIGQPILITNCGPGALPITNARIEGSDAAEFAIIAQPSDPSIGADASASWTVVMSAHTVGPKQAQFAVDTAGGTTSVPLTGEGLASGSDGGGSDTTGEHNYYSCSAGGAGGLAPAAVGLALAARVLRRRRRRVA